MLSGNYHAIDAVSQVGMSAARMQLTARIIDRARSAQQHSVQRRRRAKAQFRTRLFVGGVLNVTDSGCNGLQTRRVWP